MTMSEFQSHLIKLDTTFRGDKALNTGKRPPNTEDEFVHLQSRALLQLRGRPVASGEPAGVAPSPTSDDRLRHQREHRELLVVQPRGPPEAATFFEAYGQARDEQRTFIFCRNSGKGKTPLASCLAAMVARDVGLDKFVMVSSPDMLRSAVERNLLRDERPLLLDELQISSSNIGAQGGGVDTLKHLLGLSPDLPATIKCRYNDVKVPAETFRIITVQDLHNLDDMAKVRPPDLMLEGQEWRARPLDKVFDADTRAVLTRCILVEVTAQCVKDSVREKRKFGSDKAISMAESLRALRNGQ